MKESIIIGRVVERHRSLRAGAGAQRNRGATARFERAAGIRGTELQSGPEAETDQRTFEHRCADFTA